MNKIKQAFENNKAFIAFITCGDPDLETTEAAIRAAVSGGADLIELGIPFSDPTAEGPVIQGANLRALKGGITTDKIFAFVENLRRDITVPMVFMTYSNVVFSYGTESFLSVCSHLSIDGLILPDLPFEEKEEFLPVCRKYGVDLISLIAPTSKDRIAKIAKEAEGFLYIVSSLGVTGVRTEIQTDLKKIMEVVRQNTSIPCAIGFVENLRRDITVPMVFMTYSNVVFSYGTESFLSVCSHLSIDGLILPDLPFEEKEEFLPVCRKYGVDLISLIAPTSKDRIAKIAKEAEGFLYIVSSLGVTGVRTEIQTDLKKIMEVVRQNTSIPCAIGFGISTPVQARKMAELADGVIVGSAIVKFLEQYGSDAPEHIGSYVKSMTDAIDRL